MKHIIYILLLVGLAVSQEYIWPTNTGKQMTSNFGEFRGDHFHMGIDIRTNQSTGHPLYAVSDGYIYRITTNFKGYGKALYLKTSDNKIVLYGHLTSYTPALEERLHSVQEENQSYYVNQYFTKDEYPVRQGDVIAYSGNSGGSMGPHLHFELRNNKDQPLNPLTYGFPVEDKTPPTFLGLAILPINEESLINNSALPKSFVPNQITKAALSLNDTIAVSGPIALAVRVVDKIPYSIFSYQIEQIQLLVDSVSVFIAKYDSLDFTQDNLVRTVLGQPVTHEENEDFQKLYRLPYYPQLLLHPNYDNGVIEFADGSHKIDIIAIDAAQNESSLSFYIDYTDSVVAFDVDSTLEFQFSDYFKTDLIVLENGSIFSLETNHFQNDSVVAFIEKTDTLITFPLVRNEDTYSSRLINNHTFDDCINSGFIFVSDTVAQYNFVFDPQFVTPVNDQLVFSKDSLVSIKPNNVLFDSTLIWVSDVSSRYYKYRKNRISNVYEIYPKGIPYKDDLSVQFKVKRNSNFKQNAIYRYDKKKSKWKYVKSITDTNTVSAEISEPRILAVFKDDKLPWIESAYPSSGQTIKSDSLLSIQIIVGDNLSGIDYSEEHLRVFLDGKRLWVAYQPFEEEISYMFRESLTIGEHNLKINIQDRSGNSISKSIKFFVE